MTPFYCSSFLLLILLLLLLLLFSHYRLVLLDSSFGSFLWCGFAVRVLLFWFALNYK